MGEQPMTPREAADRVEQSPDYDPGDCVRVLIDHARATPAPSGGDLAALADTVRGVRNRLCADELIDEADAELLRDVRIKLDRHRCAPTALVTGEQLLALADKLQNVIPGGGGWLNVAEVREELRRLAAPAPVEPLKVGDTVTTADELDRLPVGAVVRNGRYFLIAWRHVNGWSTNREDAPADTRGFLVDQLARGAKLRVLDVGGAP